MSVQTSYRIPETHEIIRLEDIRETIELFAEGNAVLPRLNEDQLFWLDDALHRRKELCASQYQSGSQDKAIAQDIQKLDAQITALSPHVLAVLHFLCRIRALVPILSQLKAEKEGVDGSGDELNKTVTDMKYRCAVAEAEDSIQGLASMRVRPRLLDDSYLKNQLSDADNAAALFEKTIAHKRIVPPTAEETEEALDLFFSEENAVKATLSDQERCDTEKVDSAVPIQKVEASPLEPMKKTFPLKVNALKRKEIRMAGLQCRVYVAMQVNGKELSFPQVETAALARHVISMAVSIDAERLVILGNAQGAFSLALDSVSPAPAPEIMEKITLISQIIMLLGHDKVIDLSAVKALLFNTEG